MIVIDASALVELLLQTPRSMPIVARLSAPLEEVHAPHLIDLETASALRTLEGQGHVSPAEASRAIHDLIQVDLIRYAHEPLIPRVWQLRGNITPYDAVYVALAEHLSAPLITCDAKLAAAPGHRATIEHFP